MSATANKEMNPIGNGNMNDPSDRTTQAKLALAKKKYKKKKNANSDRKGRIKIERNVSVFSAVKYRSEIQQPFTTIF